MNLPIYKKHFLLLSVLLIMLFFVNISLGSVAIPFQDIFSVLVGGNSSKESWEIIILNFRIPKAITAILVGSGLSVSGLLMQTLFRNPLAGPFVLGISSGASLGVALLLIGSSLFGGVLLSETFTHWSLPIAASLGAFLVLSAVIITANSVRNTMSILIIGLMFGSFATAIISVLSYFSEATKLQQFLFWSFGSLGNLSWSELLIFFIIYCFGILLSLVSIKALNTLLLGENYAKSLGLNIKQSRLLIIIATSLLAGTTTAFAGFFCFIFASIVILSNDYVFFATSYNSSLFSLHGTLVCLGLILYSIGSKAIPAAELTLLSLTEVIGGIFWVWLPLFGINEIPTTNTIIGGFFLFISLTYYSLVMRWNKRYIGLN